MVDISLRSSVAFCVLCGAFLLLATFKDTLVNIPATPPHTPQQRQFGQPLATPTVLTVAVESDHESRVAAILRRQGALSADNAASSDSAHSTGDTASPDPPPHAPTPQQPQPQLSNESEPVPWVAAAKTTHNGGVTNKGMNQAALQGPIPEHISEDPLWEQTARETCSLNFTAIIRHQLGPWLESGIKQAHVDDLYCQRKHVARISYVGGELRYGSWQLGMDVNRLRSALWFIHLATERAKLRGNPIPPFEVVINPTDKTSEYGIGGTTLGGKRRPLLCNAKCDGDASISFPIMFNAAFGTGTGEMSLALYRHKYSELVAMGRPGEWHAKIPKMFFSSTNTRGHRAAIFDSEHPGVVALPEVVPISLYGDFQYLIYAFGHSGWSQRLRELAFMDAVLLLEESQCREYYHDVFTPHVDYIPVAEDLSNLDDALERAMSGHDRRMAQRWRAKGYEVLSLPCVLDYVEGLLREYARLQRFAPQQRPDHRPYAMTDPLSVFSHRTEPPDAHTCTRAAQA
ncbi:hypothetical protein PTSG_10711 [Salpingoeca rosetta]|uniref:Glycosyl transferase CAP10 domain-containing protein n=1 Tax=Salpingoeca rosetta (strain ATCC 50818 / BSB-021) TaxID=946362 RepID=F2UQ59_SALR5|nr:uncharacterized protein PTSG_10711 [Salpingoeca rosetta]EGD79727.1 hypothetical protein PTSG_10711 [Salpingoeca rosetta]|eukprot:XP_004988676.1 hypothetical protein PTSG_10711 [Salpingoeca rosetta]